MCCKHQYPSYTLAKRDAKALRRRMHKAFDVFRCKDCAAWHVGSHRIDERIRRLTGTPDQE